MAGYGAQGALNFTMKAQYTAVICLLTILLTGMSLAQNPPKIGLVLSGGGAKGFAHIGAIRALEEAGIKPDIVTGTSMGSIVGALYAMGYSTEEMEAIAREVDWTSALSNDIDMSEITWEEKPYYGRFLAELTVNENGVSLPGGLIIGQNLQLLLSEITMPVHHIKDFKDFPISFACVATNIETGEPVTLDQGDIVKSLRASMAIPSIFTPVTIDSMLLIDGGWVRNLPVEEAKAMGADIIISVSVDAPLKTKKELTSLISIMDQTSWILSTIDTRRQKEMSDYLIEPEVADLSTFDFEKSDTIVQRGYIAAKKQIEAFDKLYVELTAQGYSTPNVIKPGTESLFQFDRVEVEGTNKITEEFIIGRLGIDTGKLYSTEEIEHRVEVLYGTRYFEKVAFQTLSSEDGKHIFRVIVEEDDPIKLKLALYYDNVSSAGVNLNLTMRNFLLKNSRTIFDGFLAEDLKVSFNFLKYFTKSQRTYAFLEAEYVKQNEFINNNIYGVPSSYKYRQWQGGLGFAQLISSNALVGVALNYRNGWIIPSFNADSIVTKVGQREVPVSLFLSGNTLNKPYYPTRGWRGNLSFSYSFYNDQTITLAQQYQSLEGPLNDTLALSEQFRLQLSGEKYFPIFNKFSLYLDGFMGLPFTNQTEMNASYKIGGISPVLPSMIPYWGTKSANLTSAQMAKVAFGFQWEFLPKLYAKGLVNYFNFNYPMLLINPDLDENYFEVNGKSYEQSVGGGLELSYYSFLGPVRVIIHQDVLYSEPLFFVSLGYNFRQHHSTF